MRIIGSSKITGKSQVTIPKAVREVVKLEKGDLVVYVDEKNQVVIKKSRVKVSSSSPMDDDPSDTAIELNRGNFP